ncbi:beta-lactamase/transpeptidase-like protein [Cercophora samala]|uniref:Beta-lactamase/transpeptidase-like protein n=1 Tax=Cercophora samala TaxID=330535 RepID=A0AA39ZBD0_9PEZI|nr:beta-lactamase/transpeptidase-like protein [Cercophora samala]
MAEKTSVFPSKPDAQKNCGNPPFLQCSHHCAPIVTEYRTPFLCTSWMLVPLDDFTMPCRSARLRTQLRAQSDTIAELMRAGNTPGLSVSVLCDGEPVLQCGYGWADVAMKAPATELSVYPIASITKGFTAVACGRLVHEGKLSWDERVQTYHPSFNPENNKEIGPNANLIDLLCHRTGLADRSVLYRGPNGQPLFEDENTILRAVNSMDASSGGFREVWRYCPYPFALLTRIIEKATNEPLAQVLKSRIFQPLGMTSTSLIDGDEIIGNHCKPYGATESGMLVEREVPKKAYQFPFDSAMGVRSSVVDMAIWARAVMAAYTRSQSTLRQEPATNLEDLFLLTEMDTILYPWCPLPPTLGGNQAYCLGWFLHRGHFILGHFRGAPPKS